MMRIHELYKFTSRRFQYVLSEILFEEVFEKLRKKYKGEVPPQILSVKISDKIYITSSKDRSTYYTKFELVGEYDEKPLTL